MRVECMGGCGKHQMIARQRSIALGPYTAVANATDGSRRLRLGSLAFRMARMWNRNLVGTPM